MPDEAAAPDLEFDRAALEVEAGLRRELGFPPARLSEVELKATYATRSFRKGWRIEVDFSDGNARSIDILLGPAFPAAFPRTALVNRPEYLTWPHIEHDGILCLLPVMTEIDPDDPAAVAVHLLGRSGRLVEELIEGSIIERDFREEFLTYWFYKANSKGPRIVSLLSPEPPSRPVKIWRDGNDLAVVGETREQLEQWLRNYRGETDRRCADKIEPAGFIWLPAPPLPSEYPLLASDLPPLAAPAGEEAQSVLQHVAGSATESATLLFGAEGRGGAGLVAVTTTSDHPNRSRSGRIQQPLIKGFREGAMPPDVAFARTYSATPVIRSNVERADAQWVHGRGKDPRTATLLQKTIALIGCGSVGSPVASRLARAGVGRLRLFDHDELNWSNVGRHELGGGSVGKNKATELAARLARDFPHLDIAGEASDARYLVRRNPEILSASDLVVVATGSWLADSVLNRWHVENGRTVPFLYGWTENRAVAGHAVLIASQGGCLRCGFGATGVPNFQASLWADGGLVEEPSCGNHFQPYGAVELGYVVDLIAEAALDALLDVPDRSVHSLWLGRTRHLEAQGGIWSEDALPLLGSDGGASRCVVRDWPQATCPICGAS